MFQKRILEALPSILMMLAIGLSVFWFTQKIKAAGFSSGAAYVQKQWDREKNAHEKEIARLKDEYDKREEQHRAENRRISYELSQAQKNHEVELSNAAAEFDRRVRSSEQRAQVYQRQAEAGADQCRSLALHASRLDASLEEGRSLVREFGSTLRLRDQQVKALSDQIRNDRELTK